MTQYAFDLAPTNSGDDLVAALDSWRDAIQSSHKGAVQPTYRVAGMFWLDDAGGATSTILKQYDGTDWITVCTFNYTANTITFAGTATLTGSETLTNKTLTSPVINTPTINNANITGATGFLMGRMIYGLTLSNNGTDATNDIDIGAGSATDASAFVLMSLAAALTKRLDAAWVVGTNQGGRMSAAAITDTTYHVWLIRRSDTGVVDVGFDVSATAPTMPTNYDQKRRIGSIIRAAGTIIAFNQVGDHFLLSVPVRDITISTSLGTTAVLSALTVPIGIKVVAEIMGNVSNAATYDILLTSPDQANTLPTSTIHTFRGAAAETIKYAGLEIRTDTSGQIRARSDVASSSFIANTNGWIDTRGAE